MHPLSWYKKGVKITVNDKMQQGYSYILQKNPGRGFDSQFKPELTPAQMLKRGVFEGKYLNDCTGEFPSEWYEKAKTSEVADPSINMFKIKSRLSLQEWRKRGWIPAAEGDMDVRGWFQWYCRYWLGRRQPAVDSVQIARWRAFVRHRAQVIKDIQKKKLKFASKKDIKKHRPKQRQALLQWAYNPLVTS